MRIGIATWTLEGESLAPKLRSVLNMGYQAVSVLNRALHDSSPDDLLAVDDLLQERDARLTIHSGFGTPPDEKATLRSLEQSLAWHDRTGRLACVSYDVPWKEIRPGLYRTDPTDIFSIFEKAAELSAGRGVHVALEDCPLDAEEFRPFEGWRERFPHWAILVDLGHMNMRLREPKHDLHPLAPGAVEDFLRGIPAEIAEAHVHSNDGTDDQHMPPYMGNADLATAVRTLGEMDFDGIYTVEIVPAWCGLAPEEVPAAMRRSFEYLSELLRG